MGALAKRTDYRLPEAKVQLGVQVTRGKAVPIGTKTVNKNGYEYTRVADERKWVGSHILVMEKHLKRRLEPGEYVAFKDPSNHAPPVTLDMIELRKRGDSKSAQARIAYIESRIEELYEHIKELTYEKESLEKGLAEGA